VSDLALFLLVLSNIFEEVSKNKLTSGLLLLVKLVWYRYVILYKLVVQDTGYGVVYISFYLELQPHSLPCCGSLSVPWTIVCYYMYRGHK